MSVRRRLALSVPVVALAAGGVAALFAAAPSDAKSNVVLSIDTIAGTGLYDLHPPDNVAATQSAVPAPGDVAYDPQGDLYIVDVYLHDIRKVSAGGVITTIATDPLLNDLGSIAVNANGKVYVTRAQHHDVARIDAGGVFTPVVGGGANSGENVAALKAQLDAPSGLAFDASNNLYFADAGTNRVRAVKAGKVTTVAGTGSCTFNGDAVAATSAHLCQPQGIAFDQLGNLFVADKGLNRVRRITPNGSLTTFAGNGVQGFGGDAGPATQASLNLPFDVTVDPSNVVHIADTYDQRVRSVSGSGNIFTEAGTGVAGYNGDARTPDSAELWLPFGVTVDPSGNLVIADYSNSRVRRITKHNLVSPAPTYVTVPGPSLTVPPPTFTTVPGPMPQP